MYTERCSNDILSYGVFKCKMCLRLNLQLDNVTGRLSSGTLSVYAEFQRIPRIGNPVEKTTLGFYRIFQFSGRFIPIFQNEQVKSVQPMNTSDALTNEQYSIFIYIDSSHYEKHDNNILCTSRKRNKLLIIEKQ